MKFRVSLDRGPGTYTTRRPHLVVGKLVLSTMRLAAGTHAPITGSTITLHERKRPGGPTTSVHHGGVCVRLGREIAVIVAWRGRSSARPIWAWSKLPIWLQPHLRPLVMRTPR